MAEKDPLAGGKEVKANFIKFSKVGDYIKGVFVESREIENQLSDKPGAMQTIYELVGLEGQFHDLSPTKEVVEPPIKIEEGEFYNVSGKPAINNAMRRAKRGQHVGIQYTGSKPNKNKAFNPTKQFRVVLFDEIDPYYGSDSLEGAAAKAGLT